MELKIHTLKELILKLQFGEFFNEQKTFNDIWEDGRRELSFPGLPDIEKPSGSDKYRNYSTDS